MFCRFPRSAIPLVPVAVAAVLGWASAVSGADAADHVPAPQPIVTKLGATPITQLSGGGGGLPDLGAAATYDAGALVTVLTAYHDSGLYESEIGQIDKVAERAVLRAVRERAVAARRHATPARARARAWHDGGRWWKKRQGIVFGIDETTLSNYAAMAADGFAPGPKTAASGADAGGVAITPTLKLYKLARSHGVSVFYITGRPEGLRQPTAENLAREGFSRYAELILRPAGSTATTGMRGGTQ